MLCLITSTVIRSQSFISSKGFQMSEEEQQQTMDSQNCPDLLKRLRQRLVRVDRDLPARPLAHLGGLCNMCGEKIDSVYGPVSIGLLTTSTSRHAKAEVVCTTEEGTLERQWRYVRHSSSPFRLYYVCPPQR